MTESGRMKLSLAGMLAGTLALGCVLLCAPPGGLGGGVSSEELFGGQDRARVPVRSTDSLGPALPRIAIETSIPGENSDDSPLTFTDAKTEVEESAAEPPSKPPLAAAGAPASDEPVGVHVVDTPQGRVIYYPYVPQGSPAEKNAGSGGTGLSGGASSSSLASVSGGGAGGQSQGVVQAADGSWEAPYGDYKAIQGSPAAVSAEATKELSDEERQFQEYKKVSERRLERVKGKVWRDHKRTSELQREFDRVKEKVRELRFKWRNGPWPNTGKRGLAGPPGATGPRGLAGNPGKEGAVVVLKEDLKPREGEIKRMVDEEVSREVGDAEREIKARDRREMRRLETRLDATTKKMAVLKGSDSSLISKMKARTAMLALDLKHAKRQIQPMRLKAYVKALEGKSQPLPPHWHEFQDAKGKVYYDNLKTGVTSWVRPKSSGAAARQEQLQQTVGSNPVTFHLSSR